MDFLKRSIALGLGSLLSPHAQTLHAQIIAHQGADTLWACMSYKGDSIPELKEKFVQNAEQTEQALLWPMDCTNPKPKAQCLHMYAIPGTKLKADWFFHMRADSTTLQEFYRAYAQICLENQGEWSLLESP